MLYICVYLVIGMLCSIFVYRYVIVYVFCDLFGLYLDIWLLVVFVE